MFSLEEYQQFRVIGWLPEQVGVCGFVIGTVVNVLYYDCIIAIRIDSQHGTVFNNRYEKNDRVKVRVSSSVVLTIRVGDRIKCVDYGTCYVFEKM